MSINVSVGVMIPVDVLEVGNEISADQLAAIQNASMASAANPMVTKDKALANALASMVQYVHSIDSDSDRTACGISNANILAGTGSFAGIWDGTSATWGFPTLYTSANNSSSQSLYVIVNSTLSDFTIQN
jgi:hypothetical protein